VSNNRVFFYDKQSYVTNFYTGIQNLTGLWDLLGLEKHQPLRFLKYKKCIIPNDLSKLNLAYVKNLIDIYFTINIKYSLWKI